MKITTTTGVVLDDEMGLAKAMNAYAKEKHLDNVRVFHTGTSYLLAQDERAVLECTRAEDILVHIDIMALAKTDA